MCVYLCACVWVRVCGCVCVRVCVQFQFSIKQLEYSAPVYLKRNEVRIDTLPTLSCKYLYCILMYPGVFILHIHVPRMNFDISPMY